MVVNSYMKLVTYEGDIKFKPDCMYLILDSQKMPK